MQMTNEEIIASYRRADKKFAQIRTLADLNVCKPMEIAEILREAGETLPGNYQPKKKAPVVESEPECFQIAKPDPDCVKSMIRKDILKRAEICVCGEREQDYGSPEDNFRRIASLWMSYLGDRLGPHYLEPYDVACMMALLKIARISTGGLTMDNWVDLAGYAACGGELQATPTDCRDA